MKEIEFDVTAFEKSESEKEKKGKPVSKVPTVRTFRADVQDLMKDKAVSRSSIAMAEAARREARGETRFPVQEKETHLGRIIFILFLVLAFGLGVGAYALIGTRFSLLSQTATSTAKEPTESPITISLVNSPREQILADISIAYGKTFLPTGGSRPLEFRTSDKDGDRVATLSEFWSATQQDAVPTALLSTLVDRFTYRVYSHSTLAGVISVSSRSYPESYAAIRDWEVSMPRALIPLISPWYDRKKISALYGRAFKDVRIGKYDARVLYDLDGTPLIAYAFMNKKALLVSGGTEALDQALADATAAAK